MLSTTTSVFNVKTFHVPGPPSAPTFNSSTATGFNLDLNPVPLAPTTLPPPILHHQSPHTATTMHPQNTRRKNHPLQSVSSWPSTPEAPTVTKAPSAHTSTNAHTAPHSTPYPPPVLKNDVATIVPTEYDIVSHANVMLITQFLTCKWCVMSHGIRSGPKAGLIEYKMSERDYIALQKFGITLVGWATRSNTATQKTIFSIISHIMF